MTSLDFVGYCLGVSTVAVSVGWALFMRGSLSK